MTDPRGRLDRTKLLAARYRAAQDRPYLASALYALGIVASDEVETMGVDRHWRCYASPAFVDATPVEELAGVWIHEVAHLLRDHHGRGGGGPPPPPQTPPPLLQAQGRRLHHRVRTDGRGLTRRPPD
ncbi:DUF2201 family putative metallopeptidase, partial [Streptomyces pseudogriseolus]|uniref:DUF2201 family putative metallopeptidase n=1 Tax=Streptomyces pseudogriseolus TaxID=36817 RepID=UPI003FA27437